MAHFSSENKDVACFLVTKISWKGRFKRILSVGTVAVSTYNPATLEITNQWLYNEVVSAKPVPRVAASCSDEFIIQTRTKRKNDALRFSSEHMQTIISEILALKAKLGGDAYFQPLKVDGFKHDWSGRKIPVSLVATQFGCQQVDHRGTVIASYKYKDIQIIHKVSDDPGGFSIEVGEQRRKHLFSSEKREEFILAMNRMANEFVGKTLVISKETLLLDDFIQNRLGNCSLDECLTSYVEFKVQKFTNRTEFPVRRLLCLSETCLVERDPASYSVVCARKLRTIVCMVRDVVDPQAFTIEYENGESRVYSGSERDLILASLVDGSRASGNRDVFIMGRKYDRSLRLLPHGYLLDEETESQCMRHIISPPPGLKRFFLIRRFNANIPYNGLTYSMTQEGFFAENKNKVILGCLESVLAEVYPIDDPDWASKCEAQLHCLHRLFASKAGFQAFTGVNG
ncbi:hypothetical protein AB6A40_000305 [Gnathostoma spinigerum]|uniref:DnaJ homologue subfamily C GRV2/DNAJC13 N-terminal domain-containing protein n=1 Tax=Gnathostoma spinigerum TaxID=75299 RepID=A0ABD6E333_9BILA